MKISLLIGIVLVVLGVGILVYRQFSYRSTETVVDLGPIKATAERTKTVPLPPILGWLLLAGGAGVIIYGSTTGKA